MSDEAVAKNNIARRSGPIKRFQGLSIWTPNINIIRDPQWGRGMETYGEGPYLAMRMWMVAGHCQQWLLFPEDLSELQTIKSSRYPEATITVQVNKNLIDFYNTYPTSMVGDNVCSGLLACS